MMVHCEKWCIWPYWSRMTVQSSVEKVVAKLAVAEAGSRAGHYLYTCQHSANTTW